jgi:hypothetical protein
MSRPAPLHIDDLARPRIPAALRVVNALGRPFAGALLPLGARGEADLMVRARRVAGFEDFGLDAGERRASLRFYQERFGVSDE